MYWIQAIVGVSHFAKYRENKPRRNANKSKNPLFHNGESN